MPRLLIAFLILLFASCSMKQTGFNSVNSGDSWAKASREIESSEVSNSYSVLVERNQNLPIETNKENVKKRVSKESKYNSEKEPVVNIAPQTENPESKRSIRVNTEKKPGRVLNVIGLLSFLLTVLAFVPIIPVFNLLLLLAGFVLAIVSLVEFADNPGKYKGKVFPIIALALFALVIIITIIVLLLILAMFT